MSNLIRYCYENGLSGLIYNGIVVLGFGIQLVFLMWYRKKYNITLKNTVLTVLLVYPASHLINLTMAWICNGFTIWGPNNIVRIYVVLPLLIILVAKVLKENKEVLLDFLAPSMAFQQFFSHAVCPFEGCCHGYPCEWGIWNPITNSNLFPNQWLECIVAGVITIMVLRLSKKNGYKGYGKAYPWFLILFGSTRFLLEFLRDNDKLFLGISNLALWALLMFVVGCIWIKRKNDIDKKNTKI